MILHSYLPLLLNLKLLSTRGDPILPNVGPIQFGTSNSIVSDPSNAPTSRTDGFSYHLNTEYGLVLHEQKTPKSLYNYLHRTRLLYRLPKPTKAYEKAMLKSKDVFQKYMPRQHPYCQLNSDKSYKKYFTAHTNTLDKAWADELETIDIQPSGRHKKQALLAAGLGALIGYYGISHYAHKKVDENYQNLVQKEFTQFNNDYKKSEKRILDIEVNNVNSIHEYFCSLVFQNYKQTSPSLAALAVDNYVNSLHHTISNALNNKLPISIPSIKALLTLCKQLNSASSLPYAKIKSLCSQDVRAHLYPEFMGFELDGSDVLLHYDVTLRSYSDTQISSIYQVNNLGYLNGTSRYTLNLPPFIYKTNTDQFVQINDDFDSLHKPEPVSLITPTCAGSLITSDKPKFLSCINDGLLQFKQQPLTSCEYFEVSNSKFLVSGIGRYTCDTDIRTITRNSIVSSGYFECDTDNSKVSLTQLSPNSVEYVINQIDSRYLSLIPIEQPPVLIYPTNSTIELKQKPIQLHHVNLGLFILLSLLFGALLIGTLQIRGTLTTLLKKSDQTNPPDNDPPNRLTNNRISKSLNDVKTSDVESTISE